MDVAQNMKLFLENIFLGVSQLAISMKSGKSNTINATEKLNDIFHNLDLVMESVTSIAKVAESNTKEVHSSIESARNQSNEISNDLNKGHFVRAYQLQLQQDPPTKTPTDDSPPMLSNRLSNELGIQRSISMESESSSSISIQQQNVMKKSKFVIESTYRPMNKSSLRQHKCITCKCILNCKPTENILPIPVGIVPSLKDLASVQDKKFVRTTDISTQLNISDLMSAQYVTNKVFSIVHGLTNTTKLHPRKDMDALTKTDVNNKFDPHKTMPTRLRKRIKKKIEDPLTEEEEGTGGEKEPKNHNDEEMNKTDNQDTYRRESVVQLVLDTPLVSQSPLTEEIKEKEEVNSEVAQPPSTTDPPLPQDPPSDVKYIRPSSAHPSRPPRPSSSSALHTAKKQKRSNKRPATAGNKENRLAGTQLRDHSEQAPVYSAESEERVNS